MIRTLKASEAKFNRGGKRGIIPATYEQLIGAFGEPTFVGSPDGKVDAEWVLYDEESGFFATVYNYRTGGIPEGIADWSIGGKVGYAVEIVRQALDA